MGSAAMGRRRQAGKRAENDTDKGSQNNEPDRVVVTEKGNESAENIFKHDGLGPRDPVGIGAQIEDRARRVVQQHDSDE